VLLKRAITEVTRGGGLIGRIRRWHERKEDSGWNKTRAMKRLGEMLETAAGCR